VIFGLLTAAVALLYFPAVARPVGRRMHAREWARLTTGAVATGAVALYLTLLSIAIPTVLRGLGGSRLARMCDELLGHLPHGAPWAGWLVFAMLVAATWIASRSYRQGRQALSSLCVEEHVGQHRPMDGFDLVVLPTEHHIAYSRNGTPKQVVVSQGLVDSLPLDQLDVLVEHERCHLAQGDEGVLVLLSVVAGVVGWMPGLGRSILVCRLARERAADESAVRDCPFRRRALADALLAASASLLGDATPAFSRAEALEERVAAMRGELHSPLLTERWLVRAMASGLRMMAGSGAITAVALVTGACSQ
jgi:hypothetical protein